VTTLSRLHAKRAPVFARLIAAASGADARRRCAAWHAWRAVVAAAAAAARAARDGCAERVAGLLSDATRRRVWRAWRSWMRVYEDARAAEVRIARIGTESART
jgi:hypothetical protein